MPIYLSYVCHYNDIFGVNGPLLFLSIPFSCWLKNEVTFYVTVVSFVTLVLVCNICVFVVVLVQIRKMRVNKPSSSRKGFLHDLRVIASLTFLLGLTWILNFIAWGPAKTPLLYLFSLLNSLQGNSKDCLCLWERVKCNTVHTVQIHAVEGPSYRYEWNKDALFCLTTDDIVFAQVLCFLLYFRFLYLPVLLSDERQCKEAVEDTSLLWKIQTDWILRFVSYKL